MGTTQPRTKWSYSEMRGESPCHTWYQTFRMSSISKITCIRRSGHAQCPKCQISTVDVSSSFPLSECYPLYRCTYVLHAVRKALLNRPCCALAVNVATLVARYKLYRTGGTYVSIWGKIKIVPFTDSGNTFFDAPLCPQEMHCPPRVTRCSDKPTNCPGCAIFYIW